MIIMEIKIWDFKRDNIHIDSFLQSMSLSHNDPLKSKEWFLWKFESSPYGKAVLACAFDKNNVVGCVAFGMGKIAYNSKEYITALSYETFVHPDYQNMGLFKKLISVAEEELKNKGVSFLYNFPNSKSLPGFIRLNWNNFSYLQTYKLKITSLVNLIFNLKHLKSPFVPNLIDLIPENINIKHDFSKHNFYADIITPIWTKEYIIWRFMLFSKHEYYIIDKHEYYVIGIVGCRGKLKEVKILYIDFNKDINVDKNIKTEILKNILRNTKADIISYSSTIYDKLFNISDGFFNVPSKSNFCSKVLDSNMIINDFKIVLPSINAHTL